MKQEPETFSLIVTDIELGIPDLLNGLTGLSRTRIKHAMSCGAVWREGSTALQRVRRASAKLKVDDKITFHHNPEALDAVALTPELMFDGKDFSVWFKPAGMTVSGSRYGDHTALNRWIETHHKSGESVFLVHRLDRFTAGLVVVAHRKAIAADLSKQFADREVEKRYHAIVHGKLWKNQTIETRLDDKSAVSRIIVIAHSDDYSFVEVRIATGRKHQIRRHLTSIGHPVVGDRQYGSEDVEQDLQLAATTLGFRIPGSMYRTEMIQFQLDESRVPFMKGLS